MRLCRNAGLIIGIDYTSSSQCKVVAVAGLEVGAGFAHMGLHGRRFLFKVRYNKLQELFRRQ